MTRTVAVVFLALTLAWLSQACASVSPERDAQANCSADFDLMARAQISCEALGDQCAYSRDALTGVASPTTLGAADAHWLCTCGGTSSPIKLYWCSDILDGKPTAK